MSADGRGADEAVRWTRQTRIERTAVVQYYAVIQAHPRLGAVASEVANAYAALAETLERGGTVFLCGNGGSMSDALHISGEMAKSFVRPRPLPAEFSGKLEQQPWGRDLTANLQAGLRAHVLGLNPAVTSAVANDISLAGAGYAQELLALARPGDALWAISTSGRARNVLYAVSVARALGLVTVGLTGKAPNPLANVVSHPVAVPETETFRVQELHLVLYHQLCLMLEAHFF